jgi:hypothetical protein
MSSGSNGKALSAFYSGDGGETRDRRGSSIAGGKWSFIVQLPREKEGWHRLREGKGRRGRAIPGPTGRR